MKCSYFFILIFTLEKSCGKQLNCEVTLEHFAPIQFSIIAYDIYT